MIKIFAPDVGISKGFGDKPTLRYSDDGKVVNFRIGKRIYDKRVEGGYRWLNLNVKAFGGLCERIRNMELKEGSIIHIWGRYDEDTWTSDDGVKRSAPVIILEEIQFAYGGGNKQNGNGNKEGASNSAGAPPPEQAPSEGAFQAQESFSGFESFGGMNPFYPEEN